MERDYEEAVRTEEWRRKGLRRYLEQSSWISPYYSISKSTLVLSLYCHHVSVNCSTSFELLCAHRAIGPQCIKSQYSHIYQCSTTALNSQWHCSSYPEEQHHWSQKFPNLLVLRTEQYVAVRKPALSVGQEMSVKARKNWMVICVYTFRGKQNKHYDRLITFFLLN